MCTWEFLAFKLTNCCACVASEARRKHRCLKNLYIYIYIWIKRLHKILDKDSAAAPKILLCSGRWWAHKLMLALPNFHLTRLGSSVRQHIQCWNLLFNGAALSLPNKWAFSLWRKRQKCTYQTKIFQIKPFALSGKIF